MSVAWTQQLCPFLITESLEWLCDASTKQRDLNHCVLNTKCWSQLKLLRNELRLHAREEKSVLCGQGIFKFVHVHNLFDGALQALLWNPLDHSKYDSNSREHPHLFWGSMDGTAFCLVIATTGKSFRCCIPSLSYLLRIWEFLLTATKKNHQVHCAVFPTIALTANLSPNRPIDKRHVPWCWLLVACLRPRYHWRSEYQEFCLKVEKASSLHYSEKMITSHVTKRHLRLCTWPWRPNSPAVRGSGGWWSPQDGRSGEVRSCGWEKGGRSNRHKCEWDMMRENDKQFFWGTHCLLHIASFLHCQRIRIFHNINKTDVRITTGMVGVKWSQTSWQISPERIVVASSFLII